MGFSGTISHVGIKCETPVPFDVADGTRTHTVIDTTDTKRVVTGVVCPPGMHRVGNECTCDALPEGYYYDKVGSCSIAPIPGYVASSGDSWGWSLVWIFILFISVVVCAIVVKKYIIGVVDAVPAGMSTSVS